MLLRFQNNFLDYALDHSNGNELRELITAGEISAKSRLNIYKNTIYQNLTNALKIAYPKLVVLVGEEFFEFLVHEYIKEALPASGVLLEYGNNFGEFMENFPSLQEYKYTCDLAKFEWLHHECHHAIEEKAITLLDIAKALEQDADYIPSMKSCVRFFHSKFPVLQIWEMCENNLEQKLEDKESFLMVNKIDQVVKITELDRVEYNFISSFPNIEGVSEIQAAEFIKKFCELKVFKL